MRRVEMKKQYILGALVFVIALVTVGFALLQSSLSINGTVSTKSNSWNIYFDNIVLNQDSVSKTLPTISNRTALSFNVELEKPGDIYEFSVDAVNDGSIDAMINNITATNLTVEQAKLIDLSYTYEDGASISSKDYLKSSTRETIKVLVKYKEDITSTDLTNSNISLPISIAIEYVQADDTAKEREEISSKVWTAVTGDGTQIGDEIAVGEEHFYVISNDGTTLNALAKYNLNVGSYAVSGTTGVQNAQATGWVPGGSIPYPGMIAFSNSNGWPYSNNDTIEIQNYDGPVKTALNQYSTHINGIVGTPNKYKARLITYTELINLGCIYENFSGTCSSSGKPWLYSCSYWTGSAFSPYSYTVWSVFSDGYFNFDNYNHDDRYGVRPVISLES